MGWIDDTSTDIRYAMRQMRAAPAFAVIAVATLALGIGANTAIFSIVHAVLMRPLPYRDADRLVHVVQRPIGGAASDSATSSGVAPRLLAALDATQLAAFRGQTRTLSHVVAYGITTRTLTSGVESIRLDSRLDGAQVSADAFEMLGVPALIGRAFARNTPSDAAVIVLSHAAWRRRFAADPSIVGRVVSVDGQPRTIVGVMPPRFAFPDAQIEFWIPYGSPVATPGLRPPRVPVIARLKDGVGARAAAAEVNALLHWLGADGVRPPAPAGAGAIAPAAPMSTAAARFALVGVEDQLVEPVRPALLVLTAAVGIVLLIACVNVANLLLARTSSRERELATRLAIGADRGRLIRQLLTESLCLAACGGVAGVALAFGGIELLRTLGATLARRDLNATLSIPRLDEVGIDASVLVFTLAVSIVTGVLFGLAPALRQSQARPLDLLRLGAGAGSSWRRSRAQRGLIVTEIAMAMLLSIGGGLLARSFVRLSQIDPGYASANVLSFLVTLPAERSLSIFAEDLVSRLRSIPGVRAAGYTRHLPTVRTRSLVPLRVTPELPAEPAPPPAPPGTVNPPQWPDTRHVSHDYLGTMRMRVVAGRGFTAGDGEGQPQVLLIYETLARSGLLGPNPIGLYVYALGLAPWEVVGIVGDVRQVGLDEDPGPQVFLDIRQLPGAARLTGPMYFVVRADPTALAPAIRSLVGELDPRDHRWCRYARSTGVELDRAPAPLCGADGGLRQRRRHPRGRGDLRGGVLVGHAAHAGDRHPGRARRASRRRDAPDPLPKRHARRAGHHGRSWRRRAPFALPARDALWPHSARSADLCRRRAGARGDGDARLMGAGPAGNEGRSADRDSRGIASVGSIP
jgi:putative ABC transport system permease protein